MKGLALVIAVACSTEVGAQPAAATAEALFKQGKQLMAAGKLAEACAAFEASQNAEPAISTLLNLANCREKNGELASAWGLFRDAERQTRSGTDAASKQMHATASSRATSLEPRIPHLTINVASDRRIAGLEVVRDGKPVDAITWNQPLPIDGGKHVIEAHAAGHTSWKTSVEVAVRDDNKTIDVPALAVTPVTATPAPTPAPAPARPAHERRIAPWIASGVALAAGGAAIGFEFWARSTYDNALAEPDPVKQGSTWQSANTKRYVADGLAGVAVGAGVLAIWLFMRGGDNDAQPSSTVQAVVGAGKTGLVWTGSW